MNNQYETDYHTSFILICKEGFGKDTIQELLNSSLLSTDAEGFIENNFNDIIFLTFFPKNGKKHIKKFEQAKIRLIDSLNHICDYISVLYDAQTACYMREISHSVYQLEREFRGLIEIIFLKQLGKKWYSSFFENDEKERDRTLDRPEFIKNLKNPLDSRDFVDLKKFVEQTVNTSKNAVIHKLEEVNFKLDSIQQETKIDKEAILTESLFILQEIKQITDAKNESLSANQLYQHLTPALSSEWADLYQKRNLWAHNYCLFTQEELNKYKLLANTVLNKIRTEVTLLSLFNDIDNPFFINSTGINISFQKTKGNGSSICRLKIKFNLPNHKHNILEISKATYKDLLNIIQCLVTLAEENNYSYLLSKIESNPFLTNQLRKLLEDIVRNTTVQEYLNENFDNFIKELKLKYLDVPYQTLTYAIDEIDSIESKMNDDLNDYLQNIFQ
ncbi:hypothetical protein P4J11_25555 [Bacillus cereus]|nr:hypothetical protein [Bacillus cereus]MEB9555123.1 hypothetical protein [Bacillus cereus]